MKKTFLIILAFIISFSTSHAHPGGHYHASDVSSLRKWEVKSGGEIVRGNFKRLAEGMVYIEGVNGREWIIPVNRLRKADKDYVNRIASKIGAVNQKPMSIDYKMSDNIPDDSIHYAWLFAVISFGIACILLRRAAEYSSKKGVMNYSRWFMMSMSVALLIISVLACKKTMEDGTGNGNNPEAIPANSTGFMDSAFAPFKPAVTTGWDSRYFYVGSNGLPQHNMMIGITSWQQQVPIPQFYAGTNRWSIPLQPVYSDTPLSTKTNLLKGAVAIAVNGIPIFNALNNRGADAFLIGELDNWGGHCGRGDDYHYHAAPMHLSGPAANLPIAYALDGFAVYGSLEPDGSAMQPLDTCHGHKLAGQNYHYHGTNNYPYVIGAMRGKVSLDPATAAPENQILPQAFADPVRPATSPLKGAVITDFKSLGIDHNLLTYKIGNKTGFVEYFWDATGKYTYKLTDTTGVTVTNQYQR